MQIFHNKFSWYTLVVWEGELFPWHKSHCNFTFHTFNAISITAVEYVVYPISVLWATLDGTFVSWECVVADICCVAITTSLEEKHRDLSVIIEFNISHRYPMFTTYYKQTSLATTLCGKYLLYCYIFQALFNEQIFTGNIIFMLVFLRYLIYT